MNKIDKERNILNHAKSLLQEIYGDFDVISEQIDKPDAAINTKKGNKKIGIEITSVDKKNIQEYMNNEKISEETQNQQIDDLLKDRSYSQKSLKKASITFPNDYIFDNVYEKLEKYNSYVDNEEYDEMIILACSSYLRIGHEFFNEYHKPWTNFLLSDKNFPFDKVIFVCAQSGASTLIYDKKLPLRTHPLREINKELGETVVRSSITPFGAVLDTKKLFEEDPHVSQKKRKKRK